MTDSKIIVFENEDFGELRTVEIDGEVWFVGKDVADILKYRNGSRDINRHVGKEDRRKVMFFDGRQQKETIVINESGVYSLISVCKTVNQDIKIELVNLISKCYGKINNPDVYIIKTRKEIEFIKDLKDFLSVFNIVGISQYKVDKYRIDYYIPAIRVAIEYDENNHKDYNTSKEQEREKYISEKIGCKFIRISDAESNAKNIGIIMQKLYQTIFSGTNSKVGINESYLNTEDGENNG